MSDYVIHVTWQGGFGVGPVDGYLTGLPWADDSAMEIHPDIARGVRLDKKEADKVVAGLTDFWKRSHPPDTAPLATAENVA